MLVTVTFDVVFVMVLFVVLAAVELVVLLVVEFVVLLVVELVTVVLLGIVEFVVAFVEFVELSSATTAVANSDMQSRISKVLVIISLYLFKNRSIRKILSNGI